MAQKTTSFLVGEYKKNKKFDTRLSEALAMMHRFPDRVPIVVEFTKQSLNLFHDITRQKFLVPNHLILANFIYLLRRNFKVPKETAIFTFLNEKTLPRLTDTIGEIYDKYHDQDKCLYITFATENTFGMT